jgi:hypothetical protein
LLVHETIEQTLFDEAFESPSTDVWEQHQKQQQQPFCLKQTKVSFKKSFGDGGRVDSSFPRRQIFDAIFGQVKSKLLK